MTNIVRMDKMIVSKPNTLLLNYSLDIVNFFYNPAPLRGHVADLHITNQLIFFTPTSMARMNCHGLLTAR